MNLSNRGLARSTTLSRQYRHSLESLSNDLRQLLIELNERIKAL